MPLFLRLRVATMLGFLAIGAVLPAQAEDFPGHPVRIITDGAPGSAIDVPVRIIADALSRVWGQQAVVINQPGAGGAIAARTAATASPDGYTLGVVALSAFVAASGTADNLPVQVPRDFTPIGYLGGAPMFIGAAPWLGVKTLADLIALAKQKPGEVPFGVNGIGRLTHLTGELLQDQRRHQAFDGALFRRHGAGDQRHDGQARRAGVRCFFGHRRRHRSRKCRAARGRLVGPHVGRAKSADGRRNAARL